MTDTRIKIPNTKAVDLAKLDAQLGGHGLNSDAEWIMAVEGSPVTKQQLQTAYDAADGNELARKQAQQNRQADYITEADPLYFGWQRGENTEQAWLDKVAEIRARYPYPA